MSFALAVVPAVAFVSSFPLHHVFMSLRMLFTSPSSLAQPVAVAGLNQVLVESQILSKSSVQFFETRALPERRHGPRSDSESNVHSYVCC